MTPTTSRTSARPAAVASAERVTASRRRGGEDVDTAATVHRAAVVPPSLDPCPRSPGSSRSRPPARCGARSTTGSTAWRRAVAVGTRLEVPFAGRTVAAVVTGLADETDVPEEKLAAPLRVLHPAIPPDLVSLALWMAEEYCSTPARAFGLVSPPAGAQPRTALVAERTAQAPEGRLTDTQTAVLERLEAGPVPAARSRRLARHRCAASPRAASSPSSAREQPAAPGAARRALNGAPARARGPTRSPRWPSSSRRARRCCTASPARARPRSTCSAAERARSPPGAGVIVLVPEIALTPQTVARFLARFGDTVAVLHSGLGPGRALRRVAAPGHRPGADRVGPRSAVLAPVAELGLIVVDEEHDASYKHEGDPRYDARHVAAERRAARRRARCSSARPRRGPRASMRCAACACRAASTAARCRRSRCST